MYEPPSQGPAATAPPRPTRRIAVLVVGCLISVVAIWYATRGMQWSRFTGELARFNWLWLVPALAAFYFSMYLRAVRWGLLFRPSEQLTGRQTFSPLMIGFAFNSILPLRVGEVIRCVAVHRSRRTGIGKAFATVFAERVLDALALLGLLVIALTIVPIDASVSYVFDLGGQQHVLDAAFVEGAVRSLLLVSVVLMVAVLLMMIPAVQHFGLRTIESLRFLPPVVREKATHLFREFSIGFQALRTPATLVQIVIHTILLWVLVGVSNWAVAAGFNIHMSFWQANAIVALIAVAILIPAAPGYWGLYEAGAVFGLLFLGVERERSVGLAFGLVTHMVQWLPIVVVGLLLAARENIRPAQAGLAHTETSGDLPPRP